MTKSGTELFELMVLVKAGGDPGEVHLSGLLRWDLQIGSPGCEATGKMWLGNVEEMNSTGPLTSESPGEEWNLGVEGDSCTRMAQVPDGL
ncbi:hypothetical protein RchiOBHm_Chr2g0126991 [Rosa chinensis]|uniref:Uncharacterized protein n=1 Tax=Rosa chinensis TaxID=74649 RepID=A0A2P6RTY6_ROSCH|nr:hypothetical protein RchiOBHm_Chr2g0126991 [Rosa chinensis]